MLTFRRFLLCMWNKYLMKNVFPILARARWWSHTMRSDHSDLDDLDSERVFAFVLIPESKNFSLVSLASMKNVLLVWYLKFDKVDKSYEKVINWSCPGFGRADMTKRPQKLQIFKRFASFTIVDRSFLNPASFISVNLISFVTFYSTSFARRSRSLEPKEQQPFGYKTNNFPFCFASWFLSKILAASWLRFLAKKPFFIFAIAHTFVWLYFTFCLALCFVFKW